MLAAWVWPISAFVFLVILWQVLADIFHPPIWLIPSPAAIVAVTVKWADQLPEHTLATTYEVVAGFGIAAIAAIPLAIIVTISPFLNRTIYPLLLGMQSMPKIAIAPLLLIWVGHGYVSKIVVVFVSSFFPIIVATTSGLEKTPPAMLDLVHALSARRLQVFFKIRFPYALPYIFVGLKVGVTLAVIGAVVGEFVGATKGLGYLIQISTAQFDTSLAFACMAILMLISVALYYLIVAIEMILVPWSAR